MEIKPEYSHLEGYIDTSTNKLICKGVSRYGEVWLNFVEGELEIPFAKIMLTSNPTVQGMQDVYEDAVKLGNEIARRWNESKDKK